MFRRLLLLLPVLVLVLAPSGQSKPAGPAVTINYRASACAQLPLKGTGTVRFFARFVNHTSRTASFGKTIHLIWLPPGGWKDSWLNTIDGTDPVPANRSKTYWAEFGADPTKPVLRCALKTGSSTQLHHVKVLR